MSTLKPIPRQAIPAALERALRYRLLNEPFESESICCDILAADPHNQDALVTLLLSLTDQFASDYLRALDRAKEVLPRLQGSYERAYYEGIINERWAKAQAERGMPPHIVAGWLQRAMHCYEQAEARSTADNPDAVLRWNTCIRFAQRLEAVEPAVTTMDWSVEAADVDDPHLTGR